MDNGCEGGKKEEIKTQYTGKNIKCLFVPNSERESSLLVKPDICCHNYLISEWTAGNNMYHPAAYFTLSDSSNVKHINRSLSSNIAAYEENISE